MAKLTISDFTSLANETSFITALNTAFTAVETAMENTLSRDGTTPNTMSQDIDMNSQDILNVNNIDTTTLTIGGLTASGFDWEGAWTTSTAYIVNDAVEHNGSSYVCIVPHTSGSSTEPGVGASWETNWDLIASKGDIGNTGQAGADLGIPYTYEANTADTDQGTGKIWFNNADPALATKLFAAETDVDGTDVSTQLGTFGNSTNPTIKAHFEFRSPDDRSKWVMGQITSDDTDDGNYREWTISGVTKGTSFVDGDAASLVVRVVGDVGTGSSTNVDEISDLTALTKASLADGVLIHVTDLTRGGHFVWDASSTDTADNGTIFEADEGGTGRWFRNYNQAEGIHSNWYAVDVDATLGIQDALDAINTAGINSTPVIFILDKAAYSFNGGGLTVPNNIGLKGKNHTTITATTNHTPINFPGTRNTSQANTLASNADAGDTTITLSAGKGANFTAEDWVLIASDDTMWTGNVQKAGEYVQIESISTDTLTLYSPLTFDYTTANSAEVQNINWRYGAHLENITIKYNSAAISSNIHVAFQQCFEPLVINCFGETNRFTSFAFYGCLYPHIKGGGAKDLVSDTTNNYLGYGIAFAGLNVGGRIEGFTSERVRHLFTTTGSGSLAPYGVPMHTRLIGCVALNSKLAAFDTHAESYMTEFINCAAYGGKGSGFQIRGLGDKVSGGTVSNVLGGACYIVANSLRCIVDGLSAERTNLGTNSEDGITWTDQGSIYDNGTDSEIKNFTVTHCGGPGIRSGTGVSGRHKWSNIVVRDACQTSTTHTYGLGTLETTTFELSITDVDVSASDTNTDWGIRVTSGNVDLTVQGARLSDTQTDLLDVDSGHSIYGIDGVGCVSLGSKSTIAVSSNEIDIGNVEGTAFFSVTTGGDINNIRGGANGTILLLHRGSVNFTLKNLGGSSPDQIVGEGFADVALTSSSHMVAVVRDDTLWRFLFKNF